MYFLHVILLDENSFQDKMFNLLKMSFDQIHTNLLDIR